MTPTHRQITVHHDPHRATDCVAEEVPVALQYNGAPHAVMMATPADLEDFARGFSLTEGIVQRVSDIGAMQVQVEAQGITLDIQIPAARAALLAARTRTLAGRSGCGLCGAQTLAEAIRPTPRVPAGQAVSRAAVVRALAALKATQPLNARTGATHAAAFADVDGQLIAVREDVGRHNALDKLIGHLAASAPQGFAVITSRASYEMVQKAAVAGWPVLVAISAPTAFAVRMAEEAGMTLVAFARPDRQVTYTCPARLRDAEVVV
jgi:FdhD protein